MSSAKGWTDWKNWFVASQVISAMSSNSNKAFVLRLEKNSPATPTDNNAEVSTNGAGAATGVHSADHQCS
ncbi:hypothetical protein GUJ93_ZPchr0002g26293 [Zizania palustris]|uniref:Uncharacterized protein n=1 Tax=Zizania palustris TaxID=103762 RepID=A0A8J5SIE7_ZIZPA|nr:hypothetical protein GUJ93_ZPchr0002g26293 [Zizania palustris]